MGIRDTLNRLEEAEKAFAGREYIAPLVEGGQVRTRIAGVVCRLRLVHSAAPGWARLKAVSTSQAEYLRPASLAEIAEYLAVFPKVRLVLARNGRGWMGLAAHHGDSRFRIEGLVPIRLPEPGLDIFETVLTRFDGHEFWYEGRDPVRDPAIAAYLRVQLAGGGTVANSPQLPAQLHKKGLTREEREAYSLAFADWEAGLRGEIEERLAAALTHAGASFDGLSEREELCTVRYRVDGRDYQSVIRADDLTVVSAGICLSGEDRKFDLTSLVGVLREGNTRGRLVTVGLMEE